MWSTARYKLHFVVVHTCGCVYLSKDYRCISTMQQNTSNFSYRSPVGLWGANVAGRFLRQNATNLTFCGHLPAWISVWVKTKAKTKNQILMPLILYNFSLQKNNSCRTVSKWHGRLCIEPFRMGGYCSGIHKEGLWGHAHNTVIFAVVRSSF